MEWETVVFRLCSTDKVLVREDFVKRGENCKFKLEVAVDKEDYKVELHSIPLTAGSDGWPQKLPI